MVQAGARAVGIVHLIRLRTTVSAPVLTLIGWADIGWHAHAESSAIVCSMISSFTLISFSQVFNDIIDRDLDAKAKPGRPIPAGVITVSQARTTAIALALVSVGAAALTGVATLCYTTICLPLSVLYSTWLKNTVMLGNVTVALVSCTMLSYGSSTVSSPWGQEFGGTIATFLYTLGNELYKTAVDSPEDAGHGLRTIATRYGLRVTARVIAVVAGLLVTLIALLGLTGLAPIRFVLAAAVVIGVPVVIGAITANVPRNPTAGSLTHSHRYWRLAWLPGALTMLLLR